MDPGTLQLLLLLAFGLLLLFFGFPLFRFLVVLGGAAVGFAYGPSLLTALTARPVEPWMALAAALVAAVVLGLLAWLAYWAVVFLWGAGIGFQLAAGATDAVLLALLAAVVLGILAVIFQRVMIVLLTAFSGAWFTVTAGAGLLGFVDAPAVRFDYPAPWVLVVVTVLAAVGVVAQFRRSGPA
ncbi:MAG TPA: hypothetical protein VF168_02860 [Trueperaceae bacterium]